MIHIILAVWHWFLVASGSLNTSGTQYGFWSGFAGDIFLFTAVFTWYWHHSCHANGCFRIGLHKVDGTPYTVCRKHHPSMKARGEVTLEHIRALYNDNKEAK